MAVVDEMVVRLRAWGVYFSQKNRKEKKIYAQHIIIDRHFRIRNLEANKTGPS